MHGAANEWVHDVANLNKLTLFRSLLEEPPLRSLIQAAIGQRSRHEAGAQLLFELSHVEAVWDLPPFSFANNPWEAWLTFAILNHDNPWARRVERGECPGPLLDQLMRHDLHLLNRVRPLITHLVPPEIQLPQSNWQPGRVLDPPPRVQDVEDMVKTLADATPWNDRIEPIRAFIQSSGAGPFNLAAAFAWDAATGKLKPTYRLDPVQLSDLIGYEHQRQKVRHNTERLLAGAPANNLLLYGDRGTGKSATVKALIHQYRDAGLRLVEVSKSNLSLLPSLVNHLGDRGRYFILFIDDLSFETEETEYKELKALLEGSIQAPPTNVKVYATSNRRHLVRENFSDRAGMVDGDVRAKDTMEERLSLADRFGETIVFPAPGEEEYLTIVQGLATQKGIDLPADDLAAKALRWARWQNGRSGRTARQFIDTLVAATQDE